MKFQTLRMIVVAAAIFAQIYLLFHSLNGIRAWNRSNRFKMGAMIAVGATIGGLFVLNVVLLIEPVTWADPPRTVQWVLFYLPAVWSFGSIFVAMLLLAAQVVGLLGTALTRLAHALLGQMEFSDPPDSDRRRFLKVGVEGLATAPLVLSGYGAFFVGRSCEVKEVHFRFGRALRVVQLTDIHAGIYMSRKDMRRYVDRVIELQPDLFVLTGDYVSNSIAFLPGCIEEMARVTSRYGTFAIPGNHDLWYARPATLRRMFKKHRITLLVNRHRVIETDQGPFAVAGIDDLRSGFPDLGAALKGLDPATPAVLLSHRPEIFPDAAARGVSLTLAGHYHGGQIKLSLPGGDLSLAHVRTPFADGIHRIGTSHLYVSAGIGTTFTPVRLNVPPEITVVHLT